MIYLDANASEPLRPEARAAALAALDLTGNPASVHGAGRAARACLEDARERLAARFGTPAQEVVFTSGATEALAQAIAALGAGRRVIVGATEHPAVFAAAAGAAILPVDGRGVADLAALEALLTHGGPALVALMAANNETGTLQPLAEAAALCHRHGALLLADAAQAAGRVALDCGALGAAAVVVSGHKMGGPAGAGALLLGPGGSALAPLIGGGGQERGRRGGTPGLAAIAGMAAAADAARPGEAMAGWRAEIERAAVAAGAVVIGAGAARLANTTCLGLPGVAAQTQVIALDLAGFAVSAGAACSSGKIARSHVLAAMGCGVLAGEAIRVSLPWNATAAAVAAFAEAYGAMAAGSSRRAA